MEKILLRKIKTTNFKGFASLEIDFPQQMIVLGGKNGFGKTTIFDAIELVLTGKIARLDSYNEFINKKFSFDQEKKPLVYDPQIPTVIVEVQFEYRNQLIWFKREAKVQQITNPISFDAFSKLYTKKEEEGEYAVVEETSLLPQSLIDYFDFLHYLDQEEAAAYIKNNFCERNSQLSKLFNIQKFDRDIQKVKKCATLLKKCRQNLTNEKGELTNEIDQLKESIRGNKGGGAGYIRLLNSDENWDNENPILTLNDISYYLGEEGYLSKMLYCCNHFDEYKRYKRNNRLAPYLEEKELNALSRFIYYSPFQNELKLYKLLTDKLIGQLKELTLKELSSFTLDFDILKDRIDEDSKNRLYNMRDDLISLFESSQTIEKAFSELLSQRQAIERTLNSGEFSTMSACPLCGNEYDNLAYLLKSIKIHGEKLRVEVGDMAGRLNRQYQILKELYNKQVVFPLQEDLKNKNFNQEVFQCLTDNALHEFIKTTAVKDNIHFNGGNSLIETKEKVQVILKNNISNLNPEVNYKLMDSFFSTELQKINQEVFTRENIENKIVFLSDKWRQQSSERLIRIEKVRNHISAQLVECEIRIKKIDVLKKEIEKQKTEYLKHIISNIEILFYIYSGRIMQECHFGRGMFLKRIGKDNMIIFRAGDYDGEVDALYTLSSGQLSALIMAFTLSLHKLYANASFIAIDDPVQTMDDMNLWGLMETLRHEFRDHSLLLSTHEEHYGALLRYKLSKAGISTKYYDMQELRVANNKKD